MGARRAVVLLVAVMSHFAERLIDCAPCVKAGRAGMRCETCDGIVSSAPSSGVALDAIAGDPKDWDRNNRKWAEAEPSTAPSAQPPFDATTMKRIASLLWSYTGENRETAWQISRDIEAALPPADSGSDKGAP